MQCMLLSNGQEWDRVFHRHIVKNLLISIYFLFTLIAWNKFELITIYQNTRLQDAASLLFDIISIMMAVRSTMAY